MPTSKQHQESSILHSTIGDRQVLQPTCVSIEGWKLRWTNNFIVFHRAEANQNLVEFWPSALSQLPLDRRDSVSVLVPLCGGSRDLAWLLSRPEVSRVCGIEISELGLQRLLSENPWIGSDPSRRRVVGDGVECWESADGRLRFYLGDLYSESLLAELRQSCQVVWDRAALVAVDVGDREKYVSSVRAMCEREHAWLTELIDYDPTMYGGPPHSITEQCARQLFGEAYGVELLNSRLRPDDAVEFRLPELADCFRISLYRLVSR